MRYLTLREGLDLHYRVIESSGGSHGIRDLGALESALAQPRMTFGAKELYPTLVEKASALGCSLILNHPFIDGNKRTGHAAMESFLLLSGYELDAAVDELEQIIVQVASGTFERLEFTAWLRDRVIVRRSEGDLDDSTL